MLRPLQRRVSWVVSLLWRGGLLCVALSAAGPAFGSQSVLMPPPVIEQSLQDPRLAGQAQMRFFGLRIYDAKLWVEPGFNVQSFDQYPLALELTYHRGFSREAIAKRSIQEIERQRPLAPEVAERWTSALTDWLPDVQAGDQLTSRYSPGQGMTLWRGEQRVGTLADPELAKLFFGIWLSPQTSEPDLRRALVADLSN